MELRFFGGLTEEEAAEVLKVSPETVRRDLRLAKTWLLREMDRHQTKRFRQSYLCGITRAFSARPIGFFAFLFLIE